MSSHRKRNKQTNNKKNTTSRQSKTKQNTKSVIQQTNKQLVLANSRKINFATTIHWNLTFIFSQEHQTICLLIITTTKKIYSMILYSHTSVCYTHVKTSITKGNLYKKSFVKFSLGFEQLQSFLWILIIS